MYVDELQDTREAGWYRQEQGLKLEDNRHYESLFALGTGYMTVRSCVDEGFHDDDQSRDYMRLPVNVTLEKQAESKSRYGTFLPVVEGTHPFLRVGMVNLPWFLGLVVYADGEKLDMETGRISDYHRWIDIKNATLYRTFAWETRDGKKLNILFKRFMNPELRFTCIQECKITMLSGSCDVRIVSSVDNDVRTNGYETFTSHQTGHCDEIVYSDVTTNRDNRIVTATAARVSTTSDYLIEQETRKAAAVYEMTLQEGEEATVHKASVVISDMYYPKDELLDVAMKTVREQLMQDANSLHQAHCDVWAAKWDISDIAIEANDSKGYDSQLAARLAVYHLLRAKGEDEERALICPKGLTSEVYFGVVFWDMDIFIQPFYLYTNHATARTAAMFRYHGLQGARRLAGAAGYKGARYPWNADVEGNETCPLFEYAEHQVHVTSDVVIGLWHYFKETNDTEFLFNYGAEVIMETSRYWAERVDKRKGKPGYHILGVMGPDEYTHFCNNNAYTNHSVKYGLNLAVEVAGMMKQDAPAQYQALCDKIGLEQTELDRFAEVADGLDIPVDQERNIVWQCEDYDSNYAEIDIEGIWKDKTKPFGDYILQEKRYRSKVMKQSDVAALLCLFSEDFTTDQKRASLEYYAPYNTNESSNSMCHNMILAANSGNATIAYDSWKASIDIDFGPLPRSKDGIHCANVGGMWQQIVHGFAGMVTALHTDTLTFRPCLPEEMRSITFKVYWKKDLVRVSVGTDALEVENLSSNRIEFIVNDKQATVEAGAISRIVYR
ncbi:MAG: glycosyl hydrolase family 65 protein [Kiritimatiellia bacterium]|jgi:kojibiose phosphorylase|nr:glycosyl hydrolase family 65 protein [Kiritimatiellia bacterium]MDP6811469.1 glycosyl hydrolase family 65 protein [Kiritimatiellia bacterium]